jgi:hypothetical protein
VVLRTSNELQALVLIAPVVSVEAGVDSIDLATLLFTMSRD